MLFNYYVIIVFISTIKSYIIIFELFVWMCVNFIKYLFVQNNILFRGGHIASVA